MTERMFVDPGTAGAVLLAALALGAWAAVKWSRWSGARARRRRFERGKRGEKDAVRLLEAKGYNILAEQPEVEVKATLDGTARMVTVRPDFLVKRRGKTWIAEVKTGSRAPDPLDGATRRQLLEYAAAMGDDAVLLVDMEARRIVRVGFPFLSRSHASAFLLGAAAGAGVSMLVWFALKIEGGRLAP